MKHHGLNPEQHFEFMFKAKIEPTGQRRYVMEDLLTYNRLSYNDVMPHEQAVRTENELAIKMGEHDYKNFMASYGKYLDIVYAAEKDPIVHDMLQKMIMYITLKQ